MAHQAGAYPGFRSMKRLGLGAFLLPAGWDASPSQGYPPAGTHLYTWVERGTIRVKCLSQEHNAVPRPVQRTISPLGHRASYALKLWSTITRHALLKHIAFSLLRKGAVYCQNMLCLGIYSSWLMLCCKTP